MSTIDYLILAFAGALLLICIAGLVTTFIQPRTRHSRPTKSPEHGG